ncbi:MAG: ATP-binding protein [Gammaproteobacteria bacterium]|nr:ATP-binding protein [Gammaproteobacteria bacterium]MDH5240174.1 ATP-binding protein [Gammaproteobacteria bacterium]MDH5261294.1 ATP-binding protein [Gammaproteobacteria bacterium]
MKLWPRSLLGHTVMTIALTLLLFTVISVSAAVYFIMIPMTQRYADDFAAVIVSAAHSLQSLPEDMHAELHQQLLQDHGLTVSQQSGNLSKPSFAESYYPYFSESLAQRAGEKLPIFESEADPLAWVDVPAHGKIYRIGFDKKRVGTNPPIVLIMAVAVGAILTFLASLFQVRRIVGPLNRLSAAAQKLGRGRNPPSLAEDGPEEIAALARTFNQMSSDLKEMSENRTVMIAGISHDLRTPLTRLGIVAEMLEEDPNPKLVSRLRRNLDAMNKLIGQFLQFSQGIENQCPVQVDLWQIIESLATDLKRDGTELRLHRNDPPCVYFADPAALERVLANLLKNAVQYGGREPIDINLNCSAHEVSIEIADRGPGIPADQVQAAFRPFQRLDEGRGKRTGGSGLGLAIARQLVVKHGWRIELLPREGGGTVAKLYLPPAQRLCLN